MKDALRRRRFLLLVLLLETCVAVAMFAPVPTGTLIAPPPAPRGTALVVMPPPKPVKPAPGRAPLPAGKVLRQFAFDGTAALAKWEVKEFRGKSVYEISTEDGGSFLRASSAAASSALYMKAEQEVLPELFLSWQWRVTGFPKKPKPDQLANRSQDDFAARIYVVFPGTSFFKTDIIEYIWDENLPVGTLVSSPFSSRVKLFVIRSGPGPEVSGGWHREERNLYADYVKLFEKKPKRPLGAIGLMSDSDNTGTSSAADFGDFTLTLLSPNGEAPNS